MRPFNMSVEFANDEKPKPLEEIIETKLKEIFLIGFHNKDRSFSAVMDAMMDTVSVELSGIFSFYRVNEEIKEELLRTFFDGIIEQVMHSKCDAGITREMR